jgi:hypothetical protein
MYADNNNTGRRGSRPWLTCHYFEVYKSRGIPTNNRLGRQQQQQQQQPTTNTIAVSCIAHNNNDKDISSFHRYGGRTNNGLLQDGFDVLMDDALQFRPAGAVTAAQVTTSSNAPQDQDGDELSA